MPNSIRRREHINSILSFSNCEFKIFDAIDGRSVLTGQKLISEYSDSIDLLNYCKKHQGIDKEFYGAVGLKLTSYSLLRDLEKSNDNKPLLILEDDADLEVDFVSKVEETLIKMKKEWDIILLTCPFAADPLRPRDIETGLEGINFFYGTYAYLINGCNSAKKLADLLETCDPALPIDIFFGWKCGNKEIKGYAFTQHIAAHLGNEFESTIETSCFVGHVGLKDSLYWAVKRNSNKI